MKRHLQTPLLGLAILMILSYAVVSADTQTPKNSDIEYQRYEWASDLEGKKYHRLLATPLPKGLYYFTRMTATVNIDDTPEKETIVLIAVETKSSEYPPYNIDCVQGFLVIAGAETQVGGSRKKDTFKLFDAGTYVLDVPAKPIEFHSPKFIFTQPEKNAFTSRDTTFRFVDLTGDGILDVWVRFAYSVAVISFQDGEFREIFSSYTVPGPLPDPEYVDLDKNGTYEIKIPYSLQIEGVPGAPYLPWISLYEWDGNAYVLNNERFYAENDEFLIRLLSQYNYQMVRRGGAFTRQHETYRFYSGLVYYYRGIRPPWHLEWILEHAKQNDYIQAAESILKKLPSKQR